MRPSGSPRRGAVCVVPAPRRWRASPSSRRLAADPAARRTRPMVLLGQAPSLGPSLQGGLILIPSLRIQAFLVSTLLLAALPSVGAGRPAAAPAAAAPASPTLGDLGKVGTVVFPTSCSAAAQPEFLRGVALLHSFFYEEARRVFASAAEKDPACAMAHWGEAMT